jgi:hypothetical protein
MRRRCHGQPPPKALPPGSRSGNRDIDDIPLPSAQQTSFPGLRAREAQASCFAGRSALLRAVGGGWWNREGRAPQYPFFNLTD